MRIKRNWDAASNFRGQFIIVFLLARDMEPNQLIFIIIRIIYHVPRLFLVQRPRIGNGQPRNRWTRWPVAVSVDRRPLCNYRPLTTAGRSWSCKRSWKPPKSSWRGLKPNSSLWPKPLNKHRRPSEWLYFLHAYVHNASTINYFNNAT